MFLQPDFPQNPLSLVTSEKNKRFVDYLQERGMDPAKIDEILKRFYSFRMVLRVLSKNAKNTEWLETLAWNKIVKKQYEKAIGNLEILLSDESIPSSTRETIIKQDVDKLKSVLDFFTSCFMPEPLMKPKPKSIHQMIVFQSWALFEYFNNFKKGRTDKELYDLIAELFRNLYKDTVIAGITGIGELTGELLKKNFIDSVGNLERKKYDEAVKVINPYLND